MTLLSCFLNHGKQSIPFSEVVSGLACCSGDWLLLLLLLLILLTWYFAVAMVAAAVAVVACRAQGPTGRFEA